MKKFLSLILTLALLALPFGGALNAAAAEAVYYAKIQSFSAVYDSNTGTVDFTIEFKGAILPGHAFTALVYCEQKQPDGTWSTSSMFGFHNVNFEECLTSATTLKGSVVLGANYYTSDEFRNWELFVNGKKLNTSDPTTDYYSMDSARVAIADKAAPAGKYFDIVATMTPATTPVGGYCSLKLSVVDIAEELSGGLTEIGFTVNFDGVLVQLAVSSYNCDYNDTWAMSVPDTTNNSFTFLFKGTDGLTRDNSLEFTLTFATLGEGVVDFTLTDIHGKDAYNAPYTDSVGKKVGTLVITGDPVVKGDANGDGEVDSLDAAAVLKYDAGLLATIQNADANGDGEVDSLDAAMILKYDAGLIDRL